MSVTMYTMAHKKFNPPKDKMYVPLHVGRATAQDLGYLGDDTGDNISHLNRYYSELTGMYWIWKNDKTSQYVGVCHYRRYLVNEQDRAFREEELEEILQHYDIITTKRLKLNCTYYDGYAANHHRKDLIATEKVIQELYPDYYDTYHNIIHGNQTYFGNICVMAKPLFDQYAAWLFSIFFKVQEQIDVESYDDYHKRVFGFISEILLLVWVTKNGLRPCECKVGMLCEKIETMEMKQKLAVYFREKDIQGAKQYFEESLKNRPDVLMEASDLNGELKLSMQVIASSDAEYARYGKSVLDSCNDFAVLMLYFRSLNDIVERYKYHGATPEDARYLTEHRMSACAISIAAMLYCDEEETARVIADIAEDLRVLGNTSLAEELVS
ncbi:MAG: DUF4422 domain-containing protein [Lachnospiraceae bacterium]|nr:DUF4422 domain-containing protein [Lachnospiraceae bacterium]